MKKIVRKSNDVDFLCIDGESLSIEDVVRVARNRVRVKVADSAKSRIRRCRMVVEALLERREKVYGLTTGFGKLRDVAIEPEDAADLQVNLLRSHAAGTGRPFDEDVVRAAMLLRANTLCKGNSGIRLEVIESLVTMLNDDVYPYVPSKGSVGASGDLAPLSHLSLVLICDPSGKFYPRESRKSVPAGSRTVAGEASAFPVVLKPPSEAFVPMPAGREFREVANREGWTFAPVTLAAKEGLALNNGTQFMAAIGCLSLHDAEQLMRTAELAGAMSLEAIRGIRDAFDERLHLVRPQSFQPEVARSIERYIEGSQIVDLYLNSANVYRARIHLAEAREHLLESSRQIELSGGSAPQSFEAIRGKLVELENEVVGVYPRTKKNALDDEFIALLSSKPAREQIEFFDQKLSPIRKRAIETLRALENLEAAEFARTNKVRTSVIAALDQLNEAVPDSPIVQDDYSFRCFPQVISCSFRALEHVRDVVQVEINSATDNPLIFPPEAPRGASDDEYRKFLRGNPDALSGSIIGGGNFHGEPLAIGLDYLAIAISEAGNISERRIAHLVDENHSRGLPPFLIESSGLNSGFMIAQYTAAALASENKILCHPASVDSIPTCAGTEDHVSMGTISARKMREVLGNVRDIVSIELLCAYQGLKYRQPLQPGNAIRKVVSLLGSSGVERLSRDRAIYQDFERVSEIMSSPEFLELLIPW
ncbi:MAG: aromatic amino acid lyase [Planctomycetes bacterium]|nr:aromatic amino acid lyase [Planctomycetota bacterium]